MDQANWSFPTDIRFGCGRMLEVKQCCDELNIHKPLIVTDKKLVSTKLFSKFRDNLFGAGINFNIFSNVDANPNERNLIHGLARLKSARSDGIIAFGGGSAIDLGKLLSFMSVQTRPVWDFEDRNDWWKRASKVKTLPVIALPTTAGTGSEVGRASVLTDTKNLTKKIIFHPSILPNIVILDPELTVSMPAKITAGTGMDAFAHNLEAYCSKKLHPMSHGIALEGMKMTMVNLPNCYKCPEDLKSRGQMLICATMGAVAFQKGLGAIHALSHPIGAKYNSHHGTINAILINPVLNLNKSAAEEKILAACRYLNFEASYETFIKKIDELNSLVNIPKSLSSIGFKTEDTEEIIKNALNDPSTQTNPVPLTKNNLERVLREAF